MDQQQTCQYVSLKVWPRAECGRAVKWFWPGRSYEPPLLLCGYHRRAYLHTLRWPQTKEVKAGRV